MLKRISRKVASKKNENFVVCIYYNVNNTDIRKRYIRVDQEVERWKLEVWMFLKDGPQFAILIFSSGFICGQMNG